ncbi:MAG: tetratricopeptide repeat protein [Cyclobacteriaceae bacterium]|nr:tetratricopeptide repeat protein [Cyclobacteriaceae bacterium HetDA_MAG_MS6]
MKALLFFSLILVNIPFVFGQESVISEELYNKSMSLYNECTLLIDEGNYEKAIGFLDQAMAMNKGNSDFSYASAFAHYKLKQYQPALEKIKRSLQLEPFQSDYFVLAGNIAYQIKDYASGIEYYTAALDYRDSTEIPIDELKCLYNRANCYMGLRKYQQAEQDYSQVLQTDIGNYMAHHNRGLARVRIGRTEEGCMDFEKAVNFGSQLTQRYQVKHCIN